MSLNITAGDFQNRVALGASGNGSLSSNGTDPMAEFLNPEMTPWRVAEDSNTLDALLEIVDWKGEKWLKRMGDERKEKRDKFREKGVDPDNIQWVSIEEAMRSTEGWPKDPSGNHVSPKLWEYIRGVNARNIRKKGKDKVRRLPIRDQNGNWLTKPQVEAARRLHRIDEDLRKYVTWAGRQPPWEPDHELKLLGWGGVASRDDRRVTIAAGQYHSHVGGDRQMEITEDLELEVDGNFAVSLGPQPSRKDDAGKVIPSPNPGASGKDTLVVNGNADWHFKDRMTIGSGGINRVWHGRIKRIAGMEGVICGGAFSKIYAGLSATVAAVNSGDVYIAAIRASAARSYIAGMNYRSADTYANWTLGAYFRITGTTLEPLEGSPSSPPRSNSAFAKAKRLGSQFCPLIDIMVGVGQAAVGLISFLCTPIKKLAKKPKKPPTPGPPRVRNRNYTVMFCSYGAETLG